MALRQHKRWKKPDWPELVVVLLAIVIMVPCFLWWRSYASAQWAQTTGHVTHFNSKIDHYNAADLMAMVQVDYEYVAYDEKWTGSWKGFWPEGQSPNALPRERLNELGEPNRPLVLARP